MRRVTEDIHLASRSCTVYIKKGQHSACEVSNDVGLPEGKKPVDKE